MSELMEAALAYAAQGILIFPCHPKTKSPATIRGFHDATNDADIIREWWTVNPDYNIAFSPHTSGLGVVDLDPPDGIATWKEYCHQHGGIIPTRTIRTPRGGLHLYYEGELPTSVRKVLPGRPIDTRGNGSYALLPPSITPDGVYVLAKDIPPAPLPDFLAIRCQEMRVRPTVTDAPDSLDKPADISRAEAYLRQRAPAVEGQGGDMWTVKTAMDLRDLGISEALALDMLAEWNERCEPPWDEYGLARKIENGYRYASNPEPGAYATHATGTTALARIGKPAYAGPFPFARGADRATLAMPEPLIVGYLPADGTSLLSAPRSSGKSFVALGGAFAVATATLAFGTLAVRKPGPVIYMAGEGYVDLCKQRLGALFQHAGTEDSNAVPFYTVNGVPRAHDQTAALDLMAAIEHQCDQPPALIVIDTLARSMAGLNENDASDAGLMLDLMERVASTIGCHVQAIAHEGKDVSRGTRGSSAFEAGVDVIWRAKGMGEPPKLDGVELTCMKDKAGEGYAPIHLLGEKGQDSRSLVLRAVSKADFQRERGSSLVELSGPAIGQALARLGTYYPATQPTPVLIREMVPEADENMVHALSTQLNRLIKSGDRRIMGYVIVEPKGTRQPALWALPAE